MVWALRVTQGRNADLRRKSDVSGVFLMKQKCHQIPTNRLFVALWEEKLRWRRRKSRSGRAEACRVPK